MGYYARLATEPKHHISHQPDFFHPQESDLLALRLAELQLCLDELDAIRPHNPSHPLYDRYFYANFVCDEIPYTAQSLLHEIDAVKEQIVRRDMHWLEQQQLLTSIRNTGADHNGQIVFAAIFLPELSRCA